MYNGGNSFDEDQSPIFVSVCSNAMNPILLRNVERVDRDMIKKIYNAFIIKCAINDNPLSIDVGYEEKCYYSIIIKWKKPKKFFVSQTLLNDIEDINPDRISDIWVVLEEDEIDVGLKITKSSSQIKYTQNIRKKKVEEKKPDECDNKKIVKNNASGLRNILNWISPFGINTQSLKIEEKEIQTPPKKRKLNDS